MAGANFGDCKCGFPKSAHAESAMKGDRRGERQEDDGTLNATLMQPGYGVPGLMGTPMDQYGLMGQMGRGAGAYAAGTARRPRRPDAWRQGRA